MMQYNNTDYSQNEMLYDGQSDYSTSGYGSGGSTPIDYASGGSFGYYPPVDSPQDFGLGILPQDGTQIDYGTSGYPNSDVVVDYRGQVLVDYAPKGGGLGLAPDGVDLYAPRNDEGLQLPDFKGTFYDDNPILSSSTDIPSAQSEATFHDDASSPLKQGTATETSSTPATPATPAAKPVSKNLKPYIYAGIAIVAILIVVKVMSKK